MNVYAATGYLGKDCRAGMSGTTAVLNFNLAVKSGYGDKEQTLWFDCAYFGKVAEGRLKDYLLKGAQVAVTGELGEREYEGKVYKTIKCTKVDLIGGRSDISQHQATAPQAQPQQFGGNGQGGFATPAGQPHTRAPSATDLDDNIPF